MMSKSTVDTFNNAKTELQTAENRLGVNNSGAQAATKTKPKQADPRNIAQGLAATPLDDPSFEQQFNGSKYKLVDNEVGANNIGGQLAIKPPVDENGEILKVKSQDEVLEAIEDAKEDLREPEPDEEGVIKTDESAAKGWLGVINTIKNTFQSLTSMLGSVVGDAAPAAKQLLEKNKVKKANGLATHGALAVAAGVGLSSLNNFFKAFEAWFGRKDAPVPGVFEALSGFLKVGFSALLAKDVTVNKEIKVKEKSLQVGGIVLVDWVLALMAKTAPGKGLAEFFGVQTVADGAKSFNDFIANGKNANPEQGAAAPPMPSTLG